jgi:hypothetical protein
MWGPDGTISEGLQAVEFAEETFIFNKLVYPRT